MNPHIPYIGDLCTIQDVGEVVNQTQPADSTPPTTAEDATFASWCALNIPAVSEYIQQQTRRIFVPYEDVQTYYFDDMRDSEYNLRRHELYLRVDLLSLTSIAWNGDVLASTRYRLYPSDRAAADTIRFDPSNVPSFDFGDFDAGIVVTGTWGYHTSERQYTDTTTLSAAISTATETSISVTDASAIGVRAYIKITDELMQVTARDTDANTLTVERAVNGHTATAHSDSATVRLWNVTPAANRVAARITAHLWETRTSTQQTIVYPDGTRLTQGMPNDVQATIDGLARPMRPLSV